MEGFDGAVLGDSLVIEIGFNICEDFYYGPSNDFTSEQWEQLSEPLPRPNYKLFENLYALSRDVQTNPADLIAYYQAVLRLANKYSKKLPPHDPLFWIKPMIIDEHQRVISFCYMDTFPDSESWAEAILKQEEEFVWGNGDQGWEIEICQDDKFFFYRCVVENIEGEVTTIMKFSKERHKQAVKSTIERTAEILKIVRKETGLDLMSYYPPWQG